METETELSQRQNINESRCADANQHGDRILAEIRVFMAILIMLALVLVVPCATAQTFTASPHAGFHEPMVEALLYNPPVAEVTQTYPYKREPDIVKLKPTLILSGRGLPEGAGTLTYRIEVGEKLLFKGSAEVSVLKGGNLENELTLAEKYPEATRVSYELTAADRTAVRGYALLRWSRFRGQVRYLDGGWRSTYIELHPNGFALPGTFYVPVMGDGRFDAFLPARVYSVINVNGTGYSYNSMERWAWDYDLTRDREDVFTIGRTELYGIHAFNVKGGARTVFVTFRPTALSRVLRFDIDGDGLVSGAERDKMGAALKESPTAIGPELEAKDVMVWLDGKPQTIAQFNKVPEYDGDTWQVQYLLQFYPDPSPQYLVWHEIKLEVRSKETLHGKEIIDFGQGSVGFYRQ